MNSAQRYEWNRYEQDGETVYQLRDRTTVSLVEIVASCGMNVMRFIWQGQQLILSPPSLAALRERPTRYGIPILSLPGSTENGVFEHRGVRYQLPLNRGAHHLHGEICRLPWKMQQIGADHERGAYIQASYSYRDDPERFAYFPQALTYILTYTLLDGVLSMEACIQNDGKRYAPFALGFHPYFQTLGSKEQVSLQIPARAEWDKDQSGHALALSTDRATAEQLKEGTAWSQVEGRLFFLECGEGDVGSPDCLEKGAPSPSAYVCRIADRARKVNIAFEVDRCFSKLVLFFPDWGEAVSLEPHTCVPNAFNLSLPPAETGVMELAPYGKKRLNWTITAKRMDEEAVN
ncbi:aldose 1-epimerase [Paenibacillus sp. GXUN7292]|uniref:aldose 1-epimerase n=1 Tax=Paenibacillus sp. GXUN7292 TaxID=3422499 RepID=UPI003D7CEEC6